MITGTIITIALVAGYAVTVGLYLLLTLGIASASPAFVAENFRLRNRYKLVNDLVWLLCTMTGSFATALVGGAILPWTLGTLLAAVLIAMLWKNSWEARQRGLPHQLLMTVLTVVGVAAGYALRMRAISIS